MRLPKRTVPLTVLMTVLSIGCSSNEDVRLVELAREADRRQAEQNEAMARQNEQIAEAAKQLVEADAKSRQEMVSLEREIQAERATIGEQRDLLDAERKELSQERRRDSLLGQGLAGLTAVIACLLPLILAWFLLRGLQSQSGDEALGELLVMELAGEQQSLLLPDHTPRPPADGLLALQDGGDTDSSS